MWREQKIELRGWTKIDFSKTNAFTLSPEDD